MPLLRTDFHLVAALILVGPLATAQRLAPRPAVLQPSGPTVLIDTSVGRVTCRLYAKEAPELTTNFIGLATGSQDWTDPASGEPQHGKPFYDGTGLFGQTDAIGGGDRVGMRKGTAGDFNPAPPPNGLLFDRPGRLAMTVVQGQLSRSLFFITQHADLEIDKNRGVIFGQCDDASVQRVTEISHALLSVDNHPSKPIAINKISVLQAGEAVPPVAPDVPSASILPQPTPFSGPDPLAPQPTGPTALIETKLGPISCRLFEKEAPIATKTFIGLAEGTLDWKMPGTHAPMHGKPFYNGLLFNRVIPDFMIQNQNFPGGANTGGDIGIKYDIEVVPNLTFDRPGRLAMANAGPNTNSSSFFITDAPRHSGLDEHFTIFGQCDDASLKVVAAIARVSRNDHNRPISLVVIRKITIQR